MICKSSEGTQGWCLLRLCPITRFGNQIRTSFEAGKVFRIEPFESKAVQIEHSNRGFPIEKRTNNLTLGESRARNVSWVLLHVGDQKAFGVYESICTDSRMRSCRRGGGVD